MPQRKPKVKKISAAERKQLLEKEVDDFLATLQRKDDDKDDQTKRDKIGRPLVITPFFLRKLEAAFLIGCNDREACIYAGVAERTFYDFCKRHPEFSQAKEAMKQEPVLAARLNIVKALKRGSIDDSWKYVKAKRKDEFAEKTITEDQTIYTPDELEAIARGDVKVTKGNDK